MVKWIFFCFSCCLCQVTAYPQTVPYRIITQDVWNFWEACDSLRSGVDTTQVFQHLVVDRASESFLVFIKKWNIRASNYKNQIRRFPNFYKTLRTNTLRLIQDQDSVRRSIARLKLMDPDLIEADICVGIGNFSTGGNVEVGSGKKLVYIGLEFHGLGAETYLQELPTALLDYVSRSNFYRTIIHELIHIQQHLRGKAVFGNYLVNRILTEGIPEYVGQLIVPSGNNGNHHEYGLEHEAALKPKLQATLWQKGSGDWFGGDDKLFVNQPRDLGYFMGARIAARYYERNPSLKELIEIRSLKQFIRKSRYFE